MRNKLGKETGGVEGTEERAGRSQVWSKSLVKISQNICTPETLNEKKKKPNRATKAVKGSDGSSGQKALSMDAVPATLIPTHDDIYGTLR